MLPDRLSELLTLAIKDAKELDRDVYCPDSVMWHLPRDGDRCYFSLAGAVMANTLEAKWTLNLSPYCYNKDTYYKLMAIESMSGRDIDGAAVLMKINTHRGMGSLLDAAKKAVREETYFGWVEFDRHLEDMAKVRDILERAGL